MANRDVYNDQFVENNIAYNLIEKVDLEKDQKSNQDKLLSGGIKRDDLREAITYLKTAFSGKYPQQTDTCFGHKNNATKSDYAKAIFNFVQLTFPNYCLKCESDYLPYKQDSAEGGVTCFICKTPAHDACYQKDAINLNHGIVFICKICIQNEGKAKKDVVVEEEVKEKVDDISDHSSSSDSEDTKDEDSDKEGWTEKRRKVRKKKAAEDKPNKKEQICPLLLEGRCPHGNYGKKCEYMHKKICHRYTSFGTTDMHRAGCKFGLDCRYLHPTLCQNSVRMRTCLNENCKLAHLRYTKRSQDDQQRQHSSYRDQTYPGQNFNPRRGVQSNSGYQEPRKLNPRYQNTRSSGPKPMQNNPNSGSFSAGNNSSEDHLSTQHFLANAMERMQRQLSNQIQQQIQMQFQQFQTYEYQEADFPNLSSNYQTDTYQQQSQQW